jgi:RNA polymerase sigma-70 factor (ECF subfamily)
VSTLYQQYAGFVRRVVRVHGVGAWSVEDAVQDVFVVVFRRFHDFVPNASHKTWLFAIAARVARDHRRRINRKGGLTRFEPNEVACSRADPSVAASTLEALRTLEGRLGLLPRDRREVFILAELEQMTAPEIARTLSMKLNTVYSRLRAARRELTIHRERTASADTATHLESGRIDS